MTLVDLYADNAGTLYLIVDDPSIDRAVTLPTIDGCFHDDAVEVAGNDLSSWEGHEIITDSDAINRITTATDSRLIATLYLGASSASVTLHDAANLNRHRQDLIAYLTR